MQLQIHKPLLFSDAYFKFEMIPQELYPQSQILRDLQFHVPQYCSYVKISATYQTNYTFFICSTVEHS